MKILLLKDILKVGRKGEIIEVSNGYAKNAIIPKKLGVIADERIINQYNQKKKREGEEHERKGNEINELIKKFEEKVFSFEIKAGDNGELFSSVHDTDIKNKILEFIKDFDKDFSLEEIHFESKPIKEIGTKKIDIKIGKGDIAKSVQVHIEINPNIKN